MTDSSLFDSVADQLNARTGMDSIAARGTLRLALKSAGLDPKHVTPLQMHVVLERVLPRELETRGVREPAEVCSALAEEVRRVEGSAASRDTAPEDIFRRMRDRAPA